MCNGGTDDKAGWWVIYKHGREEEQREAFDFVIVATGVNAIPAMPEDYKARQLQYHAVSLHTFEHCLSTLRSSSSSDSDHHLQTACYAGPLLV